MYSKKMNSYNFRPKNSTRLEKISADSEDDTDEKILIPQKKRKISKPVTTTIFLAVSFNGRHVVDSSSSPPVSTYYESVSSAAHSNTLHAKKIKITLNKEHQDVLFEDDIMPHVKSALDSLTIPVKYDEV